MYAEEISADFLEQVSREQIKYADLRLQDLRELVLVFCKKDSFCDVLSSEQRQIRGVGVRALSLGEWGFSSASLSSMEDIEETTKTAISLAKNVENLEFSKKINLADCERTYITTVTLPDKAEILSIEEIVNQGILILKSLDTPDYIDEIRLRVEMNVEDKIFISTDGTQISQSKLSHLSTIRFSGSKGVMRGNYSMKMGGLGNTPFNDLEKGNLLEESIKRTKNVLEAKTVRSGNYPTILTPVPSWYLVHESLGHAVEADTVLSGRSIFSGLLGHKIASQLVTIVDDPSVPSLGAYAYDDDGVKAAGSVIVEDGMLSDYLHNRETAGALSTMSTGNSRAEGFGNFPLVRMSNFFVEPGDMTIEELLDVEKRGIYIVNAGGGTADSFSGTFRLPVNLAYEVKNGEITTPIRNFTVIGNMLSFLGRVNGVGNRVVQTTGTCGKEGQIALQGALSPALRASQLTIVSDY